MRIFNGGPAQSLDKVFFSRLTTSVSLSNMAYVFLLKVGLVVTEPSP